MSVVSTKVMILDIYPTAPVPSVMSKMVAVASSWNREKALCRPDLEHEPSMRTKFIFFFDKMLAKTSRLFTQDEKTILQCTD